MASAGCELCNAEGGLLVARQARWRVVRVDDADFPAYYRLIWNEHIAELSDLSDADRAACMDAVTTIERVLRQQLRPTKVNLASLGNVVPHLHWHVIARFDWDGRFPHPVWAPVQRRPEPSPAARLSAALPQLDAAVRTALATLAG